MEFPSIHPAGYQMTKENEMPDVTGNWARDNDPPPPQHEIDQLNKFRQTRDDYAKAKAEDLDARTQDEADLMEQVDQITTQLLQCQQDLEREKKLTDKFSFSLAGLGSENDKLRELLFRAYTVMGKSYNAQYPVTDLQETHDEIGVLPGLQELFHAKVELFSYPYSVLPDHLKKCACYHCCKEWLRRKKAEEQE